MMKLCFALFLAIIWAPALAADGAVVKAMSSAAPEVVPVLGGETGGLEALGPSGPTGWQPWRLGFEIDDLVKHGGRYSARCHNGSSSEHRGLTYVVELNQQAPTPITAECWSRAEAATEGRPDDYALYLDLEHMDGTPLWGKVAAFSAGTHDWQRRSVTVVPRKPIRRVAVHGIFRARSGTAWFDDFRLWEARMPDSVSLFDGVPVTRRPQPGSGGSPGPAITTDDGFALQFESDGGGILTPEPGGFSLRDVAARSDFVHPRGTLTHSPDGSIRCEAEEPTLQLKLSATYRTQGSAIRIDGEIRDLSGEDRAVTVYFTYPVDAIGWSWHDHHGSSRRIEAGGKYSDLADRGAGANGHASRYPLACISGEHEALAIGAPLDLPRFWRFGYDADFRELYAAVDLGLSPATANFPSRAAFSLVLYRPDPEWGFRSALQRYYELFPTCFTKRNAKEGIWMPFTDIATVEGFEDFGFQFKEGDNNVAFDSEHGIYSFVYVEPWSNWVRMPKDMDRSIDRATRHVRERAEAGEERDQASLTSALEDPEGRWLGRIEDQPWCDGAVLAVNPSPSVCAESGGITQFDHLWRSIERAFERSPALSGVYHDSFEMYLFPQALDYRREHFASANVPLIFDSDGRVCQSAMFEMVDFAREIAERMWPKGKMTFANGTPYETPWGAAWLDVMGTEFGGTASPDVMNYWRALCYQRPYLLLLNTNYDVLQPEEIERYMKRATAYAFFPSFFSHNASDDPYWRNPALYNRDRPVFRKYIPVISALSSAGWEPITHARSDNPKVLLERFGRPGGPLYLTVFNDSDEPQHLRVSLDAALSAPDGDELKPTEVLSGRAVSVLEAGGRGVIDLDIAAQDVEVLALHGSE